MSEQDYSYHEPEFPFVILDGDGVVDRVATEDEANEYVLAADDPEIRWERSGP